MSIIPLIGITFDDHRLMKLGLPRLKAEQQAISMSCTSVNVLKGGNIPSVNVQKGVNAREGGREGGRERERASERKRASTHKL